jgi:hypothetical protein
MARLEMGGWVGGVISLRADKDWLLGEPRRMVRATVCHPVRSASDNLIRQPHPKMSLFAM